MEAQEKILIGSIELFLKYGIKSVTMDFIAEELGVSKRTIYEHFADKTTLLTEGLKYNGQFHQQKIEKLLAESANAIEGLYLIGLENHKKMSQINPSFFIDLHKHYPKVYEAVNRGFLEASRLLMEHLFRQGIDDEIFESRYEVEKLGIVGQKFGEIISRDVDNFGEAEQKNIWHKHFMLPFLSGLCTPKGRELLERYFDSNTGELNV